MTQVTSEADLYRALGAIESKVASMCDEVKRLADNNERRLDNHSERLQKLESWRTRSIALFTGGFVVMSSVLSGAVWLFEQLKAVVLEAKP
jgi:hypothetical protein